MAWKIPYFLLLAALLIPLGRWFYRTVRRGEMQDERRRAFMSDKSREAEDKERWWDRQY